MYCHTWMQDSVSVSEMPTRPAIRWQKCITFLLRNCSCHLIAGPSQWKCGWCFCWVTKKLRADLSGAGGLWPEKRMFLKWEISRGNAVWNLKVSHPHNSRSLAAILNSFLSPQETWKILNCNCKYSRKEVSFFLAKGIHDGCKVLVVEHIIYLFAKLDGSFQILMCFSSEYYQRKIASLGVFLVSIQPHLHLLQSNQVFRMALLSTVYYAAWLINSLPIGSCYPTQPGLTTGLLGNVAARLAGTSPVWCNLWFTLCS